MNASTIVTQSKGLWRHIETNLLPEASWHLEDWRQNIEAKKDALVIRFSKSADTLARLQKVYEDTSMDSIVTHCREDCASILRRSQWIDDALRKRLSVLAKRWGKEDLQVMEDVDHLQRGRFTAPAHLEVGSVPWEYLQEQDGHEEDLWETVDGEALEQEYQQGQEETAEAFAAQFPNCVRAGKAVGVVIATAALGISAVTGLVFVIYLGSWLGSIAALFFLGWMLELFMG